MLKAKPYLIAELGTAHDGDYEAACRMATMAAQAGFDAVKLQLLDADTLAHPSSAYYQLFKDVGKFPLHRLGSFAAHCQQCGVDWLASVFHHDMVDMLVEHGASAVKIASGDITYDALLEAAGRTDLNIIVSTGASSWLDAEQAWTVIEKAAKAAGTTPDVYFLHCTSEYPTAPADVHMRAMNRGGKWKLGYSDHTAGENNLASIIAAGRGALVLERHVSMKGEGGPDTACCLPLGGKAKHYVEQVREAYLMAGCDIKAPTQREREVVQREIRRGCYYARAMREGETITLDDLLFLRPAHDGAGAEQYSQVVNRKLARRVKRLEAVYASHLG